MSNRAILIAGAIALALGLAVLTLKPGPTPLDRSALGVQALTTLDLPLELPRRIAPRKASDYALSILPLYDIDLDLTEAAPQTRAERLGQRTLRELSRETFDQKTQALPTLVVLPKWSGGVILTGVAVPDFLIPPQAFTPLLEQMGLYDTEILHIPGFQTQTLGSTEIALFHPQLLNRTTLPATCTERTGLPAGALLIDCAKTNDYPALSILTDPDLLNTHGLTLARNAAFITATLRQSGNRPIYLDTSPDLPFAPEDDAEAQYYTRDAATLLRFFQWPLSLLWLAGAAVFATALWRGAMRFGPIATPPDTRLETSKRAAITAKARLMRLIQNDAPMIAEFLQSRLQAQADQTFGKTPGNLARLHVKFARTNPDDAAELLSNPTDPARLQYLLERLSHAT